MKRRKTLEISYIRNFYLYMIFTPIALCCELTGLHRRRKVLNIGGPRFRKLGWGPNFSLAVI